MPKQSVLTVQDPLIMLARAAVERYVREQTILPIPGPLPEAQKQTKGVFVSLIKDGALRGCVGHVRSRQSSLAKEVIYTAIAAAVHDPRFTPVISEELEKLSYIVDVIDEIKAIRTHDQLDAKLYGVVVYHERRQGVVLPNIAGIDDVEQQLDLARRRAGAQPHDRVRMERFTIQRIIEISGEYQQTISK